MISSFLGIGGGPVNVGAFVFLFGYSAKTASSASLITILFSQISKLTALGTDSEHMAVLPICDRAATGGFWDLKSAKACRKKYSFILYITQILIFLICMLNIYVNIRFI